MVKIAASSHRPLSLKINGCWSETPQKSIYSVPLDAALRTISSINTQVVPDTCHIELYVLYDTCFQLCWRNCGHRWTLLHIFWQCPELQKLWTDVYRIISSLAGTLVLPTVELSLLHISIRTLAPRGRTVITHLQLTTTLQIAKGWKSPHPPSLPEVFVELNSHCVLERALTLKNDTFKKCQREWERDGWLILIVRCHLDLLSGNDCPNLQLSYLMHYGMLEVWVLTLQNNV